MVLKTDLSTEIAGVKLKNPVLMASGTFGYGDEITDLVDVSKLGGVITKTITLKPKAGNPPPRICETTGGMLNTIGLQNVGVERFLKDKWDDLRELQVPLIVSIAGETAQEYADIAGVLSGVEGMSAIELNLSCPNLKKKIICKDIGLVEEIVSGVTRISRVPVFSKLSAQVDDLVFLAQTCEKSGAKAVSLVNTFPGMAIDIKTRRPKLSTVTGGLSGPAIKPLALKCVWDVYGKVNIPIIGGGGIVSGEDAVEFILAGARAVSIGTASFMDTGSPAMIVEGISEYFAAQGINNILEISGKLEG